MKGDNEQTSIISRLPLSEVRFIRFFILKYGLSDDQLKFFKTFVKSQIFKSIKLNMNLNQI